MKIQHSILILLSFMLLCVSCDSDDTKIKNLELKGLKNVKFQDIKLPPKMSFILSADFQLFNPNVIGVNVQKMEFDVFVEGKKASHIVQDEKVKIPAKSEFTVPLKFKVPLEEKKLFKNIKNVFSGAWKKQGIHIQTKGHIYVNALGKPIGIPFDYEEEYRIEDYLK